MYNKINFNIDNFNIDNLKHLDKVVILKSLTTLFNDLDREKNKDIIDQLINNIKDFDEEVQYFIISSIFGGWYCIDTTKILLNLISNINYVKNHDTVVVIHDKLKEFISEFSRGDFEYKVLNEDSISFVFKRNNDKIEINFADCSNNNIIKSAEMQIKFNDIIIKKIQFDCNHKLLLDDFDNYIILFNNKYFLQEILKIFNKKTKDNRIEEFLYNNSLLYCDIIDYLKKKINGKDCHFTSIEELIKKAYSNSKKGGVKQELLTNLDKVEVDTLEGNLENNKEKYVLNFIKLNDKKFIYLRDCIYEFILDKDGYIKCGQKIVPNECVMDYLLSNFKMTDCQYLDKNIKYSFNEIDNSVINNGELKKYVRGAIYCVNNFDDKKEEFLINFKKNIVDLINIINFFKNTPDFSEKINNNNTISIDKNNFDLNENAYISTDCHGDMYAFMAPLFKSGVVKFKKNESAFLYYDMETGKAFKNYSDYTLFERNNKGNIVLIPNLEIKDETQEKLDLFPNKKITTLQYFYLSKYILLTNQIH